MSGVSSKQVVRLCPICLQDRAEVLHHQTFATPDGYALPNQFDIVACETCGMIYADTAATQADYNRYYAECSSYESPGGTGAKTPSWDLVRLEAAAKVIRRAVGEDRPLETVRVCDIGCANGGLLEALRLEGFRDLTGVDPSSRCVETTRALGFRAFVGDLSNLEAGCLSGEAPFDVVVLTAVLEHVFDVGGAVAALSRLCDPVRGMVFLEVPDAAEYENYLYAPFQDFNTEHINHYSRVSLRNLMRQFGFGAVLEESRALTGAGGFRHPSLFGAYAKARAVAVADWERDPEFRAGMDRYIARSRKIMDSLDRQLRSELPATGGDVVVYGLGQLAMKLLSETVLGKTRIAAYADGNPVKVGQRFGGSPVVRPEDLGKVAGGDAPIVVTTLLHTNGIRERIRGLGLRNPVLTLELPDY